MAIISTAEYKAYAGITDSDWDTRLDVLIPMGQAGLERYCGRTFEEATYTDAKFSGNGQCSIWIPNTPLTAVSAVKTVDSAGTETTLASTEYRFTEEGELFRLGGGSGSAWDYQTVVNPLQPRATGTWSDDAPDNILVSYTGGYSTVPDDLKGLMFMIVDSILDEAGENWKLASGADGVVNRTLMAPDLISRRFGDMCRPWRGSGLAVI